MPGTIPIAMPAPAAGTPGSIPVAMQQSSAADAPLSGPVPQQGSDIEYTKSFAIGVSQATDNSTDSPFSSDAFVIGSESNLIDSDNQAAETAILQPGRRTKATPTKAAKRALPDFAGRYEVLEFLGEGGMGTVYKVREVKTNKLFAIKVLKSELSEDPVAVRRFEQEVDAASELEHLNLVFVYGADRTSSGAPYMVMNFVDGINLSELLAHHGTIACARAIDIFTQVAEALVHAHSKNIVHRDLKPSNILVFDDVHRKNAVRVVDFGIAKVGLIDLRKTSELTQTGELFGSPLYMSPEQCVGETLDVRSDIYSFGCVMYETLCGRPPFSDENAIKTMMQHLHNSPPSMQLVNPKLKIPKDLERIVLTCLNKNPGNRYQSAKALLDDLKAVQVGRAISQHAADLSSIEFNVPRALQGRNVLPIVASFFLGSVVTFMILTAVMRSTVSTPNGSLNPMFNDESTSIRQRDINGERLIASRWIDDMVKRHSQSIYLGTNMVKDFDGGVRNSDLRPLLEARSLNYFCINDPAITDEGLQYIRACPLIYLNLDTCSIRGLDYLRGACIFHLQRLSLQHTPIDAMGMENIATLFNLTDLDLSHTNISDADLQKLSNLKHLASLRLLNCPHLTNDGVQQLRDRMPECKIFYNQF
jgi:serine/threonine protein kinase